MNENIKRITMYFGAGCVGALVCCLVEWLFGQAGLTKALGVHLSPDISNLKGWLYPRIVWGGMWGGLFLLPIMQKARIQRGWLFSLGPSLARLLYFFPVAGYGYFGLKLGVMTPFFVLLYFAIWGLVTAACIQAAEYDQPRQ